MTKAADGFRLLWHSITGDWEAARKVVDEMTDRTKTFLQTMADVNQADPSVPLIKLNPVLITAKKNVEDVTKGLKLFTTEATDGAKTRQKALDDEVQANTKYAADMIARYATLEEAQEQANDRRLDEEHDMMTKFRAIRDAGWAGVLADEAKARKEEEDLAKKEFEQTLARINTERETQEKAAQDFQRFQEQVSDKVGDVLFDFTKSLTDGSTKLKDIWKETLTTIKDLFLRTLTEMAARALVQKILIPVGLTSAGGGTGQTGTVDLGGLLNLFGGKGTGTTAAPGASLQGPTPSGAPLGGSAVGAGLGAAGLGLGVGLGANQGFTQAGWTGTGANVTAGALGGAVTGAAFGATAAGAALITSVTAGAVAGSVVPIVGTIIGAAVGALLAYGLSVLGKEPKPPELFTAIRTTAPGGGGFVPGSTRRGPFGVVGPTARLDEEVAAYGDMFLKLDQAIAAHLTARQRDLAAEALQAQREGLMIDFREFDNEIFDLAKDRMSTILRTLAREEGVQGRQIGRVAERVFAGIRRDDKNLEQLEQAFARALQFFEQLHALTAKPLTEAEQALAQLNAQFDALAEQAHEYGIAIRQIEEARRRQITQFWDAIVANLKTQQENLMRAIGGTRQGLEEALMTPAVIFARRQEELETLQGEFAGAGPGKQVAMAPELLRRIQELFQLGASADVLGQDREALLRLQQDLLSFVDEIEQVAGEDAFNQQIAKAQEQVDLLGEIKQVNDKHLTEMNTTLHNIEKFLARGNEQFVGEFQGGGRIPQTGLARVHQGEYVLSASQVRTLSSPSVSSGPMTFNMAVTVNASGMDRQSLAQAGNTIGETAWKWISNAAERRTIPLRLDK